jgi:hypothetical protein
MNDIHEIFRRKSFGFARSGTTAANIHRSGPVALAKDCGHPGHDPLIRRMANSQTRNIRDQVQRPWPIGHLIPARHLALIDIA